MVQAVAGAKALKARRVIRSRGTGEEHWRTDFLGRPGDGGGIKDEPQAFLIEMHAGETILPHFHEVDQFQIFVAGGGSLGRQEGGLLAVHYADHHTGYGPINAGPNGYSYFTLRAQSDPGAHYLHKPGYREALKPSPKRHGVASGITLSTEPVLMDRKDVAVEELLTGLERADGLGASLIRMGPGATQAGPDPRATGGQYYLVVNGSLSLEAGSYAAWSTVFVGANEAPLTLKAGPGGLEALLLQFARTAN
ncbi:MAG TPA: hypothetical protein VMN03_13605 [Burkholderiales bacterium]|nr:hypothetical protein [Burkholderiales bacterium]